MTKQRPDNDLTVVMTAAARLRKVWTPSKRPLCSRPGDTVDTTMSVGRQPLRRALALLAALVEVAAEVVAVEVGLYTTINS